MTTTNRCRAAVGCRVTSSVSSRDPSTQLCRSLEEDRRQMPLFPSWLFFVTWFRWQLFCPSAVSKSQPSRILSWRTARTFWFTTKISITCISLLIGEDCLCLWTFVVAAQKERIEQVFNFAVTKTLLVFYRLYPHHRVRLLLNDDDGWYSQW